jgi:hypothetical protein
VRLAQCDAGDAHPSHRASRQGRLPANQRGYEWICITPATWAAAFALVEKACDHEDRWHWRDPVLDPSEQSAKKISACEAI